jgi:NAD(P)-dependent dehydrogenase (short-subunit alcohol dehydrogenase family)
LDLQLTGKVAIVTGASRGIGKAVATVLAEEGARVVVVARGSAALRLAAEEISSRTGATLLPIPCDTGADDQVAAMTRQVAGTFGGIDILVNCAGTPGRLAPTPGLRALSETAMWEDLNVKVMGYLRCIRESIPYVRSGQGARIVNVSGLATRTTGSLARSMRNAAVVALTKNLADELGSRGISVCAVHPGVVRTEATPGAIASRAEREGVTVEEAESRLRRGYSSDRIVDARELACTIAFLASPRAIAVNGDVIAAAGARRWIHY